MSAPDKERLILQVSLGMMLLFGLGPALSWVRTLRAQLANSRFSFDLRN